MAKKDEEDKTPEKTSEKTAEKKPAPLPPLWEIYAPNPAYSGVHPSRARFENGVARTTDAKVARHHAEMGHDVFNVNDRQQEIAMEAFKAARAKEAEAAK